jgi:hypothetical protein
MFYSKLLKNKATHKTSAFLIVSFVLLSNCVSISSSGETMVDGRRLVGNIHSNGATKTLTLNFDGQDVCSGTYSDSATFSAQPVSLTCTNGLEGTATVDATQVSNVGSVDFNIPRFHSGRVAIPLYGKVASNEIGSTVDAGVAAATVQQDIQVPEVVTISNQQLRVIRSSVRDRLRDPSSAIFADYRALRISKNGEIELAVCGLVNAKNAYGGYTGEQMFLATIKGTDIKILGPSSAGALLCSGSGFDVTVGGDFMD